MEHDFTISSFPNSDLVDPMKRFLLAENDLSTNNRQSIDRLVATS
jgi:hypothetical protein